MIRQRNPILYCKIHNQMIRQRNPILYCKNHNQMIRQRNPILYCKIHNLLFKWSDIVGSIPRYMYTECRKLSKPKLCPLMIKWQLPHNYLAPNAFIHSTLKEDTVTCNCTCIMIVLLMLVLLQRGTDSHTSDMAHRTLVYWWF